MAFARGSGSVGLFGYEYRSSCSDGATVFGALTESQHAFTLDSQGRFAFDLVTPTSSRHYMGQITGSDAHGTLRITERYGANHQLDVHGTIICDSGTQSWTAKLGNAGR